MMLKYKVAEPRTERPGQRIARFIHQRSVRVDNDLYFALTAYAQIIQEEMGDGSRVNVSAAMRALLDTALENHREKVVRRAKNLERAAKRAEVQAAMEEEALKDQRRKARAAKKKAGAKVVQLEQPGASEDPPRQMKLVV